MPHDALFKRTFGDPANVAGELESVLPRDLVAHLDLSTLRPLPGSFIDGELAGSHADLLFEVKARGRKALLYVLFEHQSTGDRLMALRLLSYMARIWRWHVRTQKGGLPLPPIVPLVLHHSEEGWSAPSNFHALCDLDGWPEAVRRFVPEFEVRVDDLSAMPESELFARPLTADARTTLFLLEHGRRLRDALEEETVFALLHAVLDERGDEEALRPYLSYIVQVTEPGSLLFVVTRMRESLGDTVEALMNNIADELREEGRAKGVQQGLQQGLVSTLRKLLELRFGPLDTETVRRLEAAPPEALDAMTERVLTAATLAEVIGNS